MSHSSNPTALCPCTSGAKFDNCCKPILSGTLPATAEELMRSRYTAFVLRDCAYLQHSWHAETRPAQIDFDLEQRWLGLKIKSLEAGGRGDDKGVVCFAARYKIQGRGHRLEECSRFVRLAPVIAGDLGRWVYVDGDLT